MIALLFMTGFVFLDNIIQREIKIPLSLHLADFLWHMCVYMCMFVCLENKVALVLEKESKQIYMFEDLREGGGHVNLCPG